MIHVCYGLYDKDGRYSKFTATSMLSMFENVSTPPLSVMVHILHDNTLTPENRAKFNQIAECYGQIVKFYNVEELCPSSLAEIKNLFAQGLEKTSFSIAAFYRLFFDELFDSEIEKMIYLDSDVIVNLDIAELWQIELEGKPLAAVSEWGNRCSSEFFLPLCLYSDVKQEDYFNSGVLLLNLKIMRSETDKIAQAIKFVAESPKCWYFDQDILNYCFSEEYLKLPLKFNKTVNHARYIGENTITKKIYHYNNRTLKLDFDDKFNRLWFRYFEKTPFFTAEAVGHLYEGVRQLHIQAKQFAITVSAIMSGKERAFFVKPIDIEAVRQIFHVKPEEEIIPAIFDQSLQDLAISIKSSGGRKLFFILASDFQQVNAILTRAGFVFGWDYVDALEFLSENEGVPFDSYQLVKLL